MRRVCPEGGGGGEVLFGFTVGPFSVESLVGGCAMGTSTSFKGPRRSRVACMYLSLPLHGEE